MNSDRKVNKPHKLLNSNSKKANILKEVGWFALKTAAISGVVAGGVALAAPALGFTTTGVSAGSLAAKYQSTICGSKIIKGSAFTILQNIGIKGLATSTKAAVVGASAAAACIHNTVKNIRKRKFADEKCNDYCNTIEEYQKTEDRDLCCNCENSNKCNCSNLIDKRGESDMRTSKRRKCNEQVTYLESLEDRWKKVQLTDDLTISKTILKNKIMPKTHRLQNNLCST